MPAEQSNSRLTSTQLRLLRSVALSNRLTVSPPYQCLDGNEERTARSLVRRGLAFWTPPGTHVGLSPTQLGNRIVDRSSRS